MLVEEMVSLCKDLGLQKVKRRGENVMFCCPFHGERNPSCGIHIHKLVGNCFACGETFNLVKLVAHMKSISILAAKDYVSEYLNTDYKETNLSNLRFYGEEAPADDIKPLVNLAPYRSGEIVHPYLLKRGFTEDDFVKFNLGWDSVNKRITIPFFTESGELLGFSGRAVLNPSDKGYESVYGNAPKYFIYNFKAKDYFFPLNLFKPSKEVILVEGLLDAMWLHKMGYSNTLSIISAELSKTQALKLKSFNTEKIILCLDNDSAGEKGCERIYNLLKNDFTFKKCILPKKDVQECSKEELDFMFKNLKDYPVRIFKKYEE